MQQPVENKKDWLQLAIEEKHIQGFDLEKDFSRPKYIAYGRYSAVYTANIKKRVSKTYALKYLLVQLTSVESDHAGYVNFVEEVGHDRCVTLT